MTDTEVENIVHARQGAAVDFVHRTYTLLTSKKVRVSKAASALPAVTIPAYAQPTAARVVYERSREPSVELTTDDGARASVMEAALEEHRGTLRRQRETEPERFVPTTVRAERAARAIAAQAKPRGVREEGEVRAVSVRQVRVRRLGEGEGGDVARLRAEREIRADTLRGQSIATAGTQGSVLGGGGSLLEAAASGGTDGGAGAGLGGSRAGEPPSAGLGPTPLDVLDDVMRAALVEAGAGGVLESGRPAPFALVDVLTSDPSFPDELTAAALAAVDEAVPELAAAVVAHPGGLVHVVALMQPLLSGVSESTATFAAAARAFEDLGVAVADADTSLAFQLCQDHVTPALVPLIRVRPAKRINLLRVLHAFTGGVVRHRRAVIASLHELLGDLDTFLSCLSLLVYLEHDLLSVHEVYLYYARVGIAVPSPQLRAASVATISVVAGDFPAAAAPFLPKLEALASDPWWELRAQLAVVASDFLARRGTIEAADDGDDEEAAGGAGDTAGALSDLDTWLAAVLAKRRPDTAPASPGPGSRPDTAAGPPVVSLRLSARALEEARQSALRILDVVLRPGTGRSLALRVAVSHSAKALAAEPAMAPRFVECVVSLDVPVVARLLDVDPHGRPDQLPVLGHNGGAYEQTPVADEWPRDLVARVTAERFAPEAPGALPPQALLLVMSLLRPRQREDDEDSGEGKDGGDEDDEDDAGPELRIAPGLEAGLFRPLREHVAEALASPPTCRYGLEVLSFVALYGEEGAAALAHDVVVDVLLRIADSTDEAARDRCLGTVARVFGELVRQGVQDGVARCIGAVADATDGGIPAGSPLRPLADSLGV